MMHLLDWFFLLFHGAIVLFNLFGWIPARTRRLHLVVISLTFLSWIALGPLLGRGLGYCPCTEWHWDVKRALGESNLPNSYISYYLDAVGITLAPGTVDLLVLLLSVSALAVSLSLNIKEWRS